MKREFDTVIIGAGVIGLATAHSLLSRKRARSVAVIEKEAEPAQHTSGRNSGVLHSGFNLKPGSLKAKFCAEGNQRLTDFCQRKKLPYEPVGTLVVAQKAEELPVLEEILRRGTANGVRDLKIVDQKGLKELEPYAQGVTALHSPHGAIASGKAVTLALAEETKALGCEFFFSKHVQAIDEDGSNRYHIRCGEDTFMCERLVNCAGLHADEVAHLMGVGLGYTIIPFRGEYYTLNPAKRHILKSMVYPVPDLAFPFLGVHWTKSVTGDVMIGPNATLAFGRESYHPLKIDVGDTLRMLLRRNFWNLWRAPRFRELAWTQFWISISKRLFVREAQRLIPDVTLDDFQRGKSGNRAQLVDRGGRLVEDMVVERKGQSLHVLNAVSPGFTCALPFADHLVDQLAS